MSSNNFGLNNDYEYMELVLDSLDATDSYDNNAYATDWPLFIIAGKGPIDHIVAIKVMEVQIPASYYVFNTVNNTWVLTETGFGAVTVTLPVGNYTTATFITAATTALRAASPNGFLYTVTYDSLLGKFSFLNNSGATSPFSFTFGAGYGIPGIQPNSGNKNPRLWVGFPPGVTASSVVATGDSIVAPNVNCLGGPAYVYLNSNTIGSNVNLYLPEGAFNLFGGKAGPQVAKVPVNSNTGGWITWSDPDPQKYFPFDTTNTLNLIDFYLTLGNTTSQLPLQLNGLSFSIKLAILTRRSSSMGTGETAYNGRVFSRLGFNSQK